MRIRDKDGNIGAVQVVHDDVKHKHHVGVVADGLWLTPAQAERFADAIRKIALRVRKKRSAK